MKIDLEDRGVFHLELSVEEVRDSDVTEKLETALDEAQAIVFMGELDVAYLVIEVRKS